MNVNISEGYANIHSLTEPKLDFHKVIHVLLCQYKQELALEPVPLKLTIFFTFPYFPDLPPFRRPLG
jgi:hypothetical protein